MGGAGLGGALPTVEDLFAQFEPAHGDIALEVRDLVLDVLQDPEERVYLGWKGLGYHTRSGYVCGIFLRESGVALGFEHGTHLDDPDGRLSGDGSQVRYLEIPDWTPEIAAVAQGFLEQAQDPR